MFQIKPYILYYRIGVIGLKCIEYFLLHSMIFIYLKNISISCSYVAYNRFNPACGLQYANKSREDRGVIHSFQLFLGAG